MSKHTKIPKNHPVQPIDPAKAKDPVTCGHCGLTWDDSISTSITPAPSARCPFEYFHVCEEVEAEKELPVACCPRCGTDEEANLTEICKWTLVGSELDPDASGEVTEWQCKLCSGSSFWV